MSRSIILASSSPYRRQLLERLHLEFRSVSPDIDETPRSGEDANAYVRRLAEAKARAVARTYPEAVVIGSDQCALLDDTILGKPGDFDNAMRQLRAANGRSVWYHTGLCVVCEADGFCQVDAVPYEVVFRRLAERQLARYLRREQPYQCAGAIKSEGYAVALFSALRGDDPSALIGLPLIRLTGMLEAAGITVI